MSEATPAADPPSFVLQEPPILDAIEAFKQRLEPQLQPQKGRSFFMTLTQWQENRGFLELIVARYDRVSTGFAPLFDTLKEAMAKQETGKAPTQLFLQVIGTTAGLMLPLMLEIRSFYLFSKILLDRVADSIAYFGGVTIKGRGPRHEFVIRGFPKLARERGWVVDAGFSTEVATLRRRIIDYRDRMIDHLRDPRVSSTLVWNPNEPPAIQPWVFLPGDEPAQGPSQPNENLHDLLTVLDAYLGRVLGFFETNLASSAVVNTPPRS